MMCAAATPVWRASSYISPTTWVVTTHCWRYVAINLIDSLGLPGPLGDGPTHRGLGTVYVGGVFFFFLHHQLKPHIGSRLPLGKQRTCGLREPAIMWRWSRVFRRQSPEFHALVTTPVPDVAKSNGGDVLQTRSLPSHDGRVCQRVRLLTEMRVVVLITQSYVKPLVRCVFNGLRAPEMAFSSVHTRLILSVCVPIISSLIIRA